VNDRAAVGVDPEARHDEGGALDVGCRAIGPRMGRVLERFPPFVAAAIALIAGLVTTAIVTILTGVVLVEIVLHGDVRRIDNDVSHWFADHRTPTWTTLSWVGSHLAQSLTVIAIVLAVAIWLLRHGFVVPAVFLVSAVVVEATTYLVTVQFIDRQRPEVHRLESLGQGASFPSGHTAAAVALYGGVAMIAVALGAQVWVRRVLITVAVLAPLAVSVSRVYRGMHHVLDVTLGAAMGGGCLAVGVFVAWALARSSRFRRAEKAVGAP
jgi:undecaprenyl-diphosphatase